MLAACEKVIKLGLRNQFISNRFQFEGSSGVPLVIKYCHRMTLLKKELLDHAQEKKMRNRN